MEEPALSRAAVAPAPSMDVAESLRLAADRLMAAFRCFLGAAVANISLVVSFFLSFSIIDGPVCRALYTCSLCNARRSAAVVAMVAAARVPEAT